MRAEHLKGWIKEVRKAEAKTESLKAEEENRGPGEEETNTEREKYIEKDLTN